MKISVILAHPNEDSFNHAIARTVSEYLTENGHEVFFHDLYKESFASVLTYKEIPKNASLPGMIKKHCREIAEAESIIVIHPNWWGQPPALLKGWVDRVLRCGVAFEFAEGDSGEGEPVGLLKAKTAIVYNTSNTSEEREKKIFGDPLETIWRNCVFGLCGVYNFHRRNFSIIVTSTEDQRRVWLQEVKNDIDALILEEINNK